MAAGTTRRAVDLRRAGVGLEPALRPTPVDQGVTGQRQGPCSWRHGQPPERPLVGKEGQPEIAQRIPEPERLLERVGSQGFDRSRHRGPGTGEPQPQARTIEAGARQWPGLTGELVHAGQRERRVRVPRECQHTLRPWRDAHGDFGNRPQGPPGAGDQARDVVTGDVLHDPAAETQQRAGWIEQADAEHVVPRGARVGTRGPRESRADDTADGRGRTETRGLEGKHLAVLREQAFNLEQRRARARFDHEFRGLIGDDPAVATEREARCARLADEEGFGAAPQQLQRFAGAARLADARADFIEHPCRRRPVVLLRCGHGREAHRATAGDRYLGSPDARPRSARDDAGRGPSAPGPASPPQSASRECRRRGRVDRG